MQHLEQVQLKKHIDEVLTRSYLDRVYETVSMKNQAK